MGAIYSTFNICVEGKRDAQKCRALELDVLVCFPAMTEPESTSSEMEERSANVSDVDANTVSWEAFESRSDRLTCPVKKRCLLFFFAVRWWRWCMTTISFSFRLETSDVDMTDDFAPLSRRWKTIDNRSPLSWSMNMCDNTGNWNSPINPMWSVNEGDSFWAAIGVCPTLGLLSGWFRPQGRFSWWSSGCLHEQRWYGGDRRCRQEG